MNPTNKRSFIHKANRERTSESDIPNKFKVMEIIKEEFGLYPLTDEVLKIPEGGNAEYRQPDLIIRKTTPMYIIELQGPIHNWESDLPARYKDEEKLSDYLMLGNDYKVVYVFGGPDNQYPRETVVSELKKEGVPVNEHEAASYRKRKERCQRY